MRIIAGRWKGRALPGRAAAGIRPATDRVRGAVYNILQNRLDLRGVSVLDLFAGTGCLGFEALSRGAADAVFVDSGRGAVAALRQNAEHLGCDDECEIVEEDALRYLDRARGEFGLVFADPPYEFRRTPDIPLIVSERGVVARGGYLIVEHRKGTVCPAAPGWTSFTRGFGGTEVSFYTLHQEQRSPS